MSHANETETRYNVSAKYRERYKEWDGEEEDKSIFRQLVLCRVHKDRSSFTYQELLNVWKYNLDDVKRMFNDGDHYGTVALFQSIVDRLEQHGMQPLVEQGVFSVADDDTRVVNQMSSISIQ